MGSEIIKQWLGWGWLEKNRWASRRLTRRMSVGDNQSSQPVWPLGLVLSEPPSGRRCQRDAGPRAKRVPPYRHEGLPGSPRWECVVWSPNTNALKREELTSFITIPKDNFLFPNLHPAAALSNTCWSVSSSWPHTYFLSWLLFYCTARYINTFWQLFYLTHIYFTWQTLLSEGLTGGILAVAATCTQEL